MVTNSSVEDKGYMAASREVFIRMSLLAIMAVSCYLILRPFLKFIISAVIIAVAIYPVCQRLKKLLGGRETLASILCTVLLVLVIVVPCLLLAGTLAEAIRGLAQQLQAGRINLPPPPSLLEKVPVAGQPLADLWKLCSTNVSEAVRRFGPQIQKHIPALISATAALGSTLLQLLISIVFAGFLLATSKKNSLLAERIFIRIFGDQGGEYRDVVVATVRSVTNGILGVAVIQSFFASLGFWIIGLPGAGLWAVIFFLSAIVQIGALVLVPAVLYGFATFSTSRAVVFLVWCIIVGIMDNVLKPVLLGRGSKVPMGVIFLGVLGGFMMMRIIGLFVGAIIVSVAYKLFLAWLDADTSEIRPTALTAGVSASVTNSE